MRWKIDLEVKEGNDWFDINAVVWFGKYQIPFLSLKQHILHKRGEFTLPDGEVAIIPEKWFSQYGSLFSLAEAGKNLRLKKPAASKVSICSYTQFIAA